MTTAGLLEPGWREATRTTNGVRLHIIESGRAGRGWRGTISPGARVQE